MLTHKTALDTCQGTCGGPLPHQQGPGCHPEEPLAAQHRGQGAALCDRLPQALRVEGAPSTVDKAGDAQLLRLGGVGTNACQLLLPAGCRGGTLQAEPAVERCASPTMNMLSLVQQVRTYGHCHTDMKESTPLIHSLLQDLQQAANCNAAQLSLCIPTAATIALQLCKRDTAPLQ